MSDQNGRDLAFFVEKARFAARLVSGVLGDKYGMQGRDGVYFNVSEQGVSVAGGLIDKVPALDKRQKYDRLSREKTTRLFGHRRHGHTLSRQSMDESLERYAGAVAGTRYEYGFSGYIADADEIASAIHAVACGDLEKAAARKMLASNPLLPEFDFFRET